MVTTSFGEQLQFLRKEKGLTQKEFADFLVMPQPSLSAYENNRTSPTMEVLLNIAQKCNVSIDWLCGLTSSKHRLATMADVADFFYRLLEIDGFEGMIKINDRLPGDIETDQQRWMAQFTVFGNDSQHQINSSFCNLLKEIENNHDDFQSFSISKDVYEMTKEKTKEYYSKYPLSAKSYPDLTREERVKKHLDVINGLREKK